MMSTGYTLIQEGNVTDEVFTQHHEKKTGFRIRQQSVYDIVSLALALSLAANALSGILYFLHKPHENSLHTTAFGRVTLELRIL